MRKAAYTIAALAILFNLEGLAELAHNFIVINRTNYPNMQYFATWTFTYVQQAVEVTAAMYMGVKCSSTSLQEQK